MKIIYAQEQIPKKKLVVGYSVFLAGPTPRKDTLVSSWRPEFIKCLKRENNPLIKQILVPEPRDEKWPKDYLDQVNWEEEAIEYCDILAFWVPRDNKNGMPAFTTNIEFGWWLDRKENIVLGWPKNAEKVKYLEYKFKKYHPDGKINYSIKNMVKEISKIANRDI